MSCTVRQEPLGLLVLWRRIVFSRAGLALTACLFFAAPLWAQEPYGPVRVRIQQNQDQVSILASYLELKLEGRESLNPLQREEGASQGGGSQQLQLRRGSEPGQWLVRRLKPGGYESLELRGPWLELQAARISDSRSGEPLPEHLWLWPNPRGGIDIVAHLDVDSYLAGVLPSEMPVSWPLEALKAQAVAARSYALSVVEERRGQPFHLEASVKDQVYSLARLRKLSSAGEMKVLQVLEATRGQYLVDAQKDVLRAFYHADCGGHTEEARHVWGAGHRGAGTTLDSHCPSSPMAQWQVKIDRSEVEQRLGQYFARPMNARSFEHLEVGETSESGRVTWINVHYPERNNLLARQSISSQEFRRIFGFDRVRSTRFKWSWTEPSQIQLRGQGHGHGVGLCQWGARTLARRGLSAQEILAHYYPRAQLRTRLGGPWAVWGQAISADHAQQNSQSKKGDG